MALTVDPRVGFVMLSLLPVLGSSYVITFVVDTRECCQTCAIVFGTRYSFLVLWFLPLIFVLDCRVVPFVFCLCWGLHMSLLLWLIPVDSSDLCDCFCL